MSKRRQALMAFFTVQVIAITFLQKLAINIDFTSLGIPLSFGVVQLALLIFYASLVPLMFVAKPRLDFVRLGLFVLYVLIASFSIAMLQSTFSANSLLMLIACYAPFVFFFEISRNTYEDMLKVFSNVMVAIAVIIFIQHAIQLTTTWRNWPNLDELIPGALLFPNYNYYNALYYGSRFMKPNAEFFLEVSIVSQWLALAIAIEVIYFRRVWRLIFFSAALLATFAGTGLLLLAICAPVLLGRVTPKTMALVLLVVGIGVLIAVKIHWYDAVHQRFSEYQVKGSSANHRFVEPLNVMLDLAGHGGDAIFEGAGPGNSVKDNNAMWWPSAKLAFEYGFATAAAFLGFVGYILFKGAPSQRLAFMLFVFFNFMGGVIVPIWPILLFIMGGMFRFREKEAR